MTWIGRKKLAFVPLYRTNAHPPDMIPTDWANVILRRVLFDPDPTTKADNSLRAFIHAASSGRADLDVVVLPMQTIDQQDVLPWALDAQLGDSLRAQGVDVAALVMLGGPGAGTSSGFWVRFVMVEQVGVWAMEFMHSLTGFADLYTFGGNMNTFDEMAASAGTHPSAYTKAAIGWLDKSCIAQNASRSASYNLHSVGLVQPPPSGRFAAVRIGAGVPYLMIEARQRVDQFDSGIPGEGVIVYRVQTTDPLGWAQNATAPVMLLTASPVTPGNAFNAGGVNVQVTGAIPGGFAIHVRDMTLRQVDHTAQFNTTGSAGAPNACVVPALGVQNIAYRDAFHHLYRIWRDAQGITDTRNLTVLAHAPVAAGNPFGYVDPTTNSEILLYRGSDGNVHSLYWSTGPVGHDDLTGSVGAPKTASEPTGWFTADNYHHVAYRTSDGHLHELWWTGPGAVGHGDLTQQASAPVAVGDPSAYVDTARATSIVAYRAGDGHIRSLYWSGGPVGHDDLSGFAGTPTAAGDPVAYYTAHNDIHQFAYVAGNGHVFELWCAGVAPIQGWDLTAASGAPAAVGKPAAYYCSATNKKHVVYRSADGRLHDLSWTHGSTVVRHGDLTSYAGGPGAADSPAAFAVDGSKTQHVAFRGTDDHIYEILWEPLDGHDPIDDHGPITDVVINPTHS